MRPHTKGNKLGPPLPGRKTGGLSMAERGSLLSPAVPPFDVALLSCICEDGPGGPPCRAPSCSLHAWGQLFTVSFPPEQSLLTASFTSEHVLNASLRLLRWPPHLCFSGGRPLLPLGAVARVTYCSGHLVSGSPALFRPARCAGGQHTGSLPHARPHEGMFHRG